MPKSILIGIDGTASSGRAVQLGVQWAQQADALLVGLVVVDEASLRRAEPVPLGASSYKQERDNRLVTMARREVERYLEHFALRCAEARVACKLLEDDGSPAERIALEAQRYDLIMIGQRLRFQFESDHEELAALRNIVKNSPRPVVVVPEHAWRGQSIVVAHDGSLQAARALQAYLAVDLPPAGEVHVVSVHENQVEAARRGDRGVEFLRSHNLSARLHAIGSLASPAELLLEQVKALNAEMVVMGAYGESQWKEFMFGSATQAMLKECPVPLFLYH